MNHWLRLSIPVLLGIAAAIINACTVTSRISPRSFVRVVVDLEPGQQLTKDAIEPMVLSGVPESASQSLVPWEHKAVLLQRPATNVLHAGDPVFWRDFAPVSALTAKPGHRLFSISLAGMTIVPEFIRVGTEVDFIMAARDELELSPPAFDEEAGPGEEATVPQPAATRRHSPGPQEPSVDVKLLGPFHVAAVGRRITPGGDIERNGTSDERVLTIAARFADGKPVGQDTHRLLAACAGLSGEQMIGIVLSSDDSSSRPGIARDTTRGELTRARALTGHASHSDRGSQQAE